MVNGGISGINGFIDLANKVPGVSLPHLGSIPYLATGGTIKSSGMAMVGEQGPELVTLPRGATVHPNGTGPGISSSAGAGTEVHNYYVTIDAKNVKDFNSVVDIMNSLPQTARTGRGTQNMRVA
jgi:phage-related protein